MAGRVARLEQCDSLAVENLPGDGARLVKDGPAEFGVGVKILVLALVDEALAELVEHHAIDVGEAVCLVRQLAIPLGRRLGVGPRRMASAPPPPPHPSPPHPPAPALPPAM